MTWHKQMKKHKNTAKTIENRTWRHLAAFQARLDAPLDRCFSTYQYTWSERHCFCGNVAFSETARRQDSSFIKHIGRHLGLTYVSRGIIGRAPPTTSQVVSPFCARGFTYQSLSPSLPALARSILRCNLPKVVIVSSFVGWLNFIGLA